MKLAAISYSIISFADQTSNHSLSFPHFDKHQNFWNPEPGFYKISKIIQQKDIQKISTITKSIALKKRFLCGIAMRYEKDVIMLMI